MVAAAAAGVAGAKYAKDNPDQAKAGALILLVGGLILFNKISGTLEGFGDFGKDVLDKAGDIGKEVVDQVNIVPEVRNFSRAVFEGSKTDYKIDSTIVQPLGGASADYLSQYEGMEYEDFITAKGDKPSYVPGKYVAGGDYAFNFSTPRAIITTADEPHLDERFGGYVHTEITGVYNQPILEIPFTDKTLIPSVQDIGGAIKGLFR